MTFNLGGGGEGETNPSGNDAGVNEPPSPVGTPPNSEGGQENPDSLANGFLKNIPEEDRPIVEKYVKDWDAGVTKRFQSIHGQYAPYKELGEVEEIQKAVQLMRVFDENPQHIYQILQQEFGQNNGSSGGSGQNSDGQLPPEFEGLPEPFVEQFKQQQTMLENMAQVVLDLKNNTQQSSEDAQLEKTLQDLKTNHPDIDETYALSQMYAGKSPEDIGNSWNQLKTGLVEAAKNQRPAPPPILTGSGVVADTQKNVTDLSSKETRNLIAQAVRASQGD